MTDPLDVAVTALRRARAHLAGLLTTQPKLAEPLGQILSVLVEAEDALAKLADNQATERAPQAQPRLAGRKPKRYERHKRDGEEYVAEYRSDSPYPFRVPKAVFDAVVEALARGNQALRVAKLLSVLGAQLGETPAGYQLHVCLRLLLKHGLIRARRRTYFPADQKSFRRRAAALWRALPLADGPNLG